MFIIDSLIVGGLRFVLDKVAIAADRELNDPARWRRELIELQMQLETGDIDDTTFAARERVILDQLRQLGAGAVGIVGASEIASVDIEADLGESGHDTDT